MSKSIKQVVELDENYSLHTDSICTTLKYELVHDTTVKGETKRVTSRDEWYYPDIKFALKSYLQKSLRPVSSVEQFLDRVERVEKLIDNKF